MALAFRLYGKFHWPPRTAPVDHPDIAEGVVEIHYDVKQGDLNGATRSAWLRWYPKLNDADANDPPDPADLPTAHLFDDSPDDAIDRFGDNRKAQYAVWLDATAATPKHKSWLIFRGAFLFEQYREKDDSRKRILDVQWPLVTECQYRKNSKVHSVLGICCEDLPLLYFNFHLPFPVQRTSLSDGYNVRAFPFSAVYGLTPIPAQVQIPDIDTLVAGWTKDDALPALKQAETTAKHTSFPIEKGNCPTVKQLGKFGLSEYGRGPGDFALYNRSHEVTGQYWPLNRQRWYRTSCGLTAFRYPMAIRVG